MIGYRLVCMQWCGVVWRGVVCDVMCGIDQKGGLAGELHLIHETDISGHEGFTAEERRAKPRGRYKRTSAVGSWYHDQSGGFSCVGYTIVLNT